MKYKATNQDGASCKVNGVNFELVIDNDGNFDLVSAYDKTPLYREDGETALRLADAPLGLIMEFGNETAYAMADAALKAM